jgi:uncharacterized repeat protein (TIGR01451 family)
MNTHVSIVRAAVAALLCGAALWPAAAADPPSAPLATQLEASRVAVEDGREVHRDARTVRPGDTLQYRANLRNNGRSALADVTATVPVPAGTQFVAGSASPAQGALASTDGQTFAPVPLMRRVRGSDGQWRDVPVPAAEYRAVRWPARTLAAGEAFAPSVRVRVTDTK